MDKAIIQKVLKSFISRGLGAAGSFLFTLYISRELGAAEAGQFFLVLTLFMGLSLLPRMGMDNSLLKFLGADWEHQEYGRAKGIVVQALGTVLLISSVLAVVLWWQKSQINGLFSKVEITWLLGHMSAAFIAFALVWVLSSLLKGLAKPIEANFIEIGGVQTATLVGAFTLGCFMNLEMKSLAYTYLIAAWVVAAVFMLRIYKMMPSEVKADYSYASRIVSSNITLLWMSLAQFTIQWVPILILAVLIGDKEVGVYNAVHRTAMATTFILLAFNSVTAPKFAAMNVREDLDGIEALAVKSTTYMLAFATPVVALLLLLATNIMSLFGSDFEGGDVALSVLCIAQLVNVATGPVGSVLIMTGYEKLIQRNTLFVAAVSVPLTLFLVAQWGMLGAAIGAGSCLILQHLISTILVYKKLGIVVSPITRFIMKMKR